MSAGPSYVVDGLRTRVQVRGEGPALLLIGGLWSQVPLWDALLPHLRAFRTIAFDPPGIGATAVPQCPYSIRRLAAFAAGVLDAVGVEQAHVLGVSLGGAVAQQLARSYPQRVDRLVLVSTSFGAPGLPSRPGALLRLAWPTSYRDPRSLERSAGEIFGGRMREEPELVHSWDLRAPSSLRAWAYRLLGTAGWSSLAWLHRLPHRTLVVHGDDDPIVPLFNARIVAAQMPAARLHVGRGGHLLLLEAADDVVPLIAAFLDTQEQPDPTLSDGPSTDPIRKESP